MIFDILIPARFASQRFPGKPLQNLTLPDGSQKPLIQLSYEAAQRVRGVRDIYVTTDDARIRDVANGFGAKVIMTSSDCQNGTERCAQAVEVAGLDADIYVNLQGDAPLTPNWFIEDLVQAMAADQDAQMATPVLRLDPTTYAHFADDRRNGRVGGTTAVFGHQNRALYFSKEIVPYVDPIQVANGAVIPVFHHVGVYAYRPKALRNYISWPLGRLEQLRFLENGQWVKCVEVEGKDRVFWELNNPEDVGRIENVLDQLV